MALSWKFTTFSFLFVVVFTLSVDSKLRSFDFHNRYQEVHVAPKDEHSRSYDFQYAVNDPEHGTNFGHSAWGNEHGVLGSYHVHLPDGRVMKVTYKADSNGYQPVITYEGDASYPSYEKNNFAIQNTFENRGSGHKYWKK